MFAYFVKEEHKYGVWKTSFQYLKNNSNLKSKYSLEQYIVYATAASNGSDTDVFEAGLTIGYV